MAFNFEDGIAGGDSGHVPQEDGIKQVAVKSAIIALAEKAFQNYATAKGENFENTILGPAIILGSVTDSLSPILSEIERQAQNGVLEEEQIRQFKIIVKTLLLIGNGSSESPYGLCACYACNEWPDQRISPDNNDLFRRLFNIVSLVATHDQIPFLPEKPEAADTLGYVTSQAEALQRAQRFINFLLCRCEIDHVGLIQQFIPETPIQDRIDCWNSYCVQVVEKEPSPRITINRGKIAKFFFDVLTSIATKAPSQLAHLNPTASEFLLYFKDELLGDEETAPQQFWTLVFKCDTQTKIDVFMQLKGEELDKAAPLLASIIKSMKVESLEQLKRLHDKIQHLVHHCYTTRLFKEEEVREQFWALLSECDTSIKVTFFNQTLNEEHYSDEGLGKLLGSIFWHGRLDLLDLDQNKLWRCFQVHYVSVNRPPLSEQMIKETVLSSAEDGVYNNNILPLIEYWNAQTIDTIRENEAFFKMFLERLLRLDPEAIYALNNLPIHFLYHLYSDLERKDDGTNQQGKETLIREEVLHLLRAATRETNDWVDFWAMPDLSKGVDSQFFFALAASGMTEAGSIENLMESVSEEKKEIVSNALVEGYLLATRLRLRSELTGESSDVLAGDSNDLKRMRFEVEWADFTLARLQEFIETVAAENLDTYDGLTSNAEQLAKFVELLGSADNRFLLTRLAANHLDLVTVLPEQALFNLWFASVLKQAKTTLVRSNERLCDRSSLSDMEYHQLSRDIIYFQKLKIINGVYQELTMRIEALREKLWEMEAYADEAAAWSLRLNPGSFPAHTPSEELLRRHYETLITIYQNQRVRLTSKGDIYQAARLISGAASQDAGLLQREVAKNESYCNTKLLHLIQAAGLDDVTTSQKPNDVLSYYRDKEGNDLDSVLSTSHPDATVLKKEFKVCTTKKDRAALEELPHQFVVKNALCSIRPGKGHVHSAAIFSAEKGLVHRAVSQVYQKWDVETDKVSHKQAVEVAKLKYQIAYHELNIKTRAVVEPNRLLGSTSSVLMPTSTPAGIPKSQTPMLPRRESTMSGLFKREPSLCNLKTPQTQKSLTALFQCTGSVSSFADSKRNLLNFEEKDQKENFERKRKKVVVMMQAIQGQYTKTETPTVQIRQLTTLLKQLKAVTEENSGDQQEVQTLQTMIDKLKQKDYSYGWRHRLKKLAFGLGLLAGGVLIAAVSYAMGVMLAPHTFGTSLPIAHKIASVCLAQSVHLAHTTISAKTVLSGESILAQVGVFGLMKWRKKSLWKDKESGYSAVQKAPSFEIKPATLG